MTKICVENAARISVKDNWLPKLPEKEIITAEGWKLFKFKSGESINACIHICREKCRFGGFRTWFRCPNCFEKRMHLYWWPNANNFYCRCCLKLTYETCQLPKNPHLRSYHFIEKYEKRYLKKYLRKAKREEYERKLDYWERQFYLR